MMIYCCGCETEVKARLTDGREIYPHRPDLASLPFWKCDACGNHVGCHHKTRQRTRPLGCIPTPFLRRARSQIHAVLDPIWKERGIKRGKLYATMSKRIGKEFHTAEIRSVDEAAEIHRIAEEVRSEILP